MKTKDNDIGFFSIAGVLLTLIGLTGFAGCFFYMIGRTIVRNITEAYYDHDYIGIVFMLSSVLAMTGLSVVLTVAKIQDIKKRRKK